MFAFLVLGTVLAAVNNTGFIFVLLHCLSYIVMGFHVLMAICADVN